jgi:hypothetical protein
VEDEGAAGGVAGDVVVRPAVEADGPALAEVELATPIVAGDERITYDRGTDYFACSRLMEACDTVVAEIDGQAVGVHAAAFHEVRVGGVPHVVNYIHHLRILPSVQGRKVLPLLKQVAVPRYPPAAKASYVFIDARNRSILDRMHQMQGTYRWPDTTMLFELDTAAMAADGGGGAAARRGTPDDAEHVCALLEATHGSKELWPGTSVAALTQRLSRDPSQYSWDDLWLGDDAVVGLWPIGRTTRVIHSTREHRSETRPVALADLGGTVDGIVALLRAAAGSVAAEGLDRFTVFASDGSELAASLAPLSVRTRRFEFWMTRVEPPANVGDLYVDPIHF